MRLLRLVPLLALALAGCSSLSKKECLTADWESIGYRDGSEGYAAGRIGDHIQACTEHGVNPDREEYEAGRARGLELFCTGANGVRVGRLGSTYSGACPAHLEPTFLLGYDIGLQLNDYIQRMSQLRGDVQRIQNELRRKDPPPNDVERERLIYQLRMLERELGRLESDANHLERRAREF